MLKMNLRGELTVARAGKLNELDISKFENQSVFRSMILHLLHILYSSSTYSFLPAHHVCGRNTTAEECHLPAVGVLRCELQRRDTTRELAAERGELRRVRLRSADSVTRGCIRRKQ